MWDFCAEAPDKQEGFRLRITVFCFSAVSFQLMRIPPALEGRRNTRCKIHDAETARATFMPLANSFASVVVRASSVIPP